MQAKRKELEQTVRPIMTKMYQDKLNKKGGAGGRKKNRR
jgi:hypothetical protein